MKNLFAILLFIGLGTFSYNSTMAQQKNFNSSKNNTSKVEAGKTCKKSCCKKARKGSAANCKEKCCIKKAPKAKAKKEKKAKVGK
jgi:hypothetical protein